MLTYAVLDHPVVLPYVIVGRHARLHCVVVNPGVLYPRRMVAGEGRGQVAKWFRVIDKGVTLVIRETLVRKAEGL